MRQLWLLVIALGACGVGSDATAPAPTPPEDEWDQKLDDRVVDYNAALRIAALRLTGELPTMAELESIALAADQKSAYETQIHTYMASPKYARQMFLFWQDTLKMGDDPAYQTAPAFAAQVTVEDRPLTDIFTATTGTCATFNATTNTFAAANCSNGVTPTGILTDPGAMKLYFSNLAFRRVRWIQEVFACTAFPAEIAGTAQIIPNATLPYTGVFPYATAVNTLPPEGDGRIGFKVNEAQTCANCHSNINHIAPLFSHFDLNGQYQAAISVPTPLAGNPVAMLTDYLPAGEPTAWRYQKLAPDLPSLGHDIATDPAVASCVIARTWNWALGKSDIVDNGNRVPADTTQAVVDAFTASNYKLKDAMFTIFTSDDFVRF